MNRQPPFAWLFFAAALVCNAASADPPPATNPSIQDLLDEVRSLRAEVKTLRQQVNSPAPPTQPAEATGAYPLHAAPADTSAAELQRRVELSEEQGFTAGYMREKGFVIRSEDGSFLLHPWAFVQVRDATNYRQRATATSSDTETGFELPRAKFILDGNVFTPDLTFQFIWATSDTTGNLQLQDGWGRYHIPQTPLALRAGQIRDPVDHEQIIFATRSLTPDRSLVNNVLLNGDDIVKGASVSYGYDGNYPVRTEVAITSGERNFDTSFQAFPTNAADWGAAARLEWKIMGDWADYNQFTALGDRHALLVLGAGADYTEAGKTSDFTHVVDAQFNTPGRLTLYASYLGRYTRRDGGPPTTNGQFITAGPSANTYDSTIRVMGAWIFDGHFEPFIRYEYLHFDARELAAGTSNNVQDITLGMNYYFYGHRAKITAGASYLPDGAPVANTISDVLQSHGGTEFIFQAQFQLIL
ncbi:MAG TPA: hypothetical protein VG326_00345 [Tepidisphaeraceae bacterium]|nr:hypothetical protein [Tepidisphaeraceae bacterium]